jgi:putative glutamine amidotransferase
MNRTRPVVGVIGSAHLAEGKFPAQRVSERILRAAAEAAGALPLIFAGSPEITDLGALIDAVDGILLTGARANVHPSHFGEEEHPSYEPYDQPRDAMALAVIEAAVAHAVPLFGICRGFQEMNVAFGGTLHPEIRDLPGRMNHRALRLANGEIDADPNVIYAERHEVRLRPGGVFAKILGAERIRVNSLHGQGILKAGDRIVIEGVAEDETIEAVRVDGATGFALGVQWHAEIVTDPNPVNRTLFEAFGAALRKHQAARQVRRALT